LLPVSGDILEDVIVRKGQGTGFQAGSVDRPGANVFLRESVSEVSVLVVGLCIEL